MKKLNMMLALVGMLLLAAGCGKEVNVAFTTPTVDVAAGGGETTVSLTSNGDWSVEFQSDWLTVSPLSGSGDATLTLLARANQSGEARTGEVKVSTKNHTAILTVTQEMMLSPYLTVLPTEISCDRWGGAFEIAVESNVDWTLSGLPDWITASATEGSNNAHIGIQVAPINGEISEDREVVLTVASGDLEAFVRVKQSLDSWLEFSINPMELEFTYEGGNGTLLVTSAIPWTATAQADWITISPNASEGNAEMAVTVAKNTAFVSREENILFVCSYADDLTENVFVKVRQEAAPDPHFLVVMPEEISFGNEGGTAEITVECDTDWEVLAFQSNWASLSATSGTGNGTLTLTVVPNVVTEPRSLSITIVSGPLLQRVNVSQEAGEEPPTLLLSPDTLSVPYTGSISNNLTVTANVAWTLVCSDPWILLSSNSGNGNATVGVIIDLNSSESTRYGSVKAFYNGQLMDETIVVQEGKPNILETDITEINAGPEGGNFLIQLTANQSWTVEKGATWMTVDPMSGTGDAQIVVRIEPMQTMLPRTAEINIKGSLGRIIVITVTQSN